VSTLLLKMPSSDPPTTMEQPNPEPSDTSKPQSQPKGGVGKDAKPQEPRKPSDGQKLSGAELKKQAKAEKAARRAQALEEKQSGAAALKTPTQSGSAQKSDIQKSAKGPHKRGGSTVVDVRNLSGRGGQQRVTPALEVPKEEDKTVEFFRHLYKTRTTSIAGAGKEVHPAVLALGLQISNYTICGSCARLVATLQAFKMVSYTS
jgi:translation initiation factor eIF-2B subunit delta